MMRTIVFMIVIALVVIGEAGAQPPAQSNTGAIKGHIQLSGKLPGNPIIRMGMDPMCTKSNAGKRIVQEFVVATADGSMANVFVNLRGNIPQTPVPTQPVTLDQRGCIFFPRVLGVRVGETLAVQNICAS